MRRVVGVGLQKKHELSILARGAELQIASSNGLPPLHLAAEKGHLHVVRYLLEAGVSPDLADDDAYTALHYAAEGQNLSSPVRDGWV